MARVGEGFTAQQQDRRRARAAAGRILGEVEATKPTRQGFVVIVARVFYAYDSHLNHFFLPYAEVI